jgi:gamma-D-glutamyl-L-lysine dipeptidyl-peptidase
MEFGVCLQSVIPVRAVPSHKSEMVTQVLFGEVYRVFRKDKDWLMIELSYDNYTGWINASQYHPLEESEFIRLFNLDPSVSIDLVQLISNETKQTMLPIMLGSSLPGFDGHQFVIGRDTFSFDGLISDTKIIESAITPRERLKAKQSIVDDAMLFLNAPYCWGGRTPFGIDCSGFVQMVFKLKKVKLLRDASQQATQGETLNFVTEAEPGDLAFFDDPEGNITHVGIFMDKNRIIHASGKVRIDIIDHVGIYNDEEQRYSHNLRIMKRIV